MKYRVLTVSREYGSGGARIAKLVAEQLGWKVLDGELIDAIACAAHVEPNVVNALDEHVESWLRRMNRQAMRSAAFSGGVVPEKDECFDADTMTELTRQIMEQAYTDGNCVIVGRGGQTILQNKPDVFHVFIYAPLEKRVKRLKARLPEGTNAEKKARTVDAERAKFLYQRFNIDWRNPHLYDLMVSSQENEEATASLITCAMAQE
ncbi:MAG TPA: cytidylate kinase-like family protein [Terracidiphilus sp.]|nr:cytidylate kinase-like family protein [Terracidiphilus sp.]